MKILKKIMIFWACLIFAFTTLFVVPNQKAHAILPAVIAGQFVKKATGRALLATMNRQGARQATVVTMEKTIKMMSSRMTPAQMQSFTTAIGKGYKSLDNKYVKIILGAELVGVIGMLNSDLQTAADNNEMVEYNETPGGLELDTVDLADFDLAVQSVDGLTPGVPIYYTAPFPQIELFGYTVWSQKSGNSRGYYIYTDHPTKGFTTQQTSNVGLAYYQNSHIGADAGVNYLADQSNVQEESKYGITGMSFTNNSNLDVTIKIYFQTDNGVNIASNHDSISGVLVPAGEEFEGHRYVSNIMTPAQWNEWSTTYGEMEIDTKRTAQLTMNDLYEDETFLPTYPLTNPSETAPNEYEFQIPNEEYWGNPNNFPQSDPWKDPYKEHLLENPKDATVIDPNNYPETPPGTDPGTDPVTPPATGTVPGTPPGTTPGEPYIPAGQGCTEALSIPRFLPLVNTLSESFPFSIPFDLYDGFQALFAEMGSSRPNFEYTFDFNGSSQTWNINIPSYFDSWKPFTDSMLIFIFDVGMIYAFFRFMKGGN